MRIAWNGKVHPLADMYPLLDGDDMDELVEDIAAFGLRQPLVLDTDGTLIDGRNRMRACELAGIELTEHDFVVEYGLVAEFVRSANNRRRNMSAGQVAAADARLLGQMGKRRNGRWERGSLDNRKSAVISEAEQTAMRKAGLVLDWLPDLLLDVIAGTVALDAAHQQAKAEQDQALAEQRKAEAAAARLADLRTNRPDLADLVDAGNLPLEDALTVRDKAIAEQRKKDNDARVWRHKLADDLRCACSAILSASHRNNLPAALAGIAERGDLTAAEIQQAAEQLITIKNAMEAQQ